MRNIFKFWLFLIIFSLVAQLSAVANPKMGETRLRKLENAGVSISTFKPGAITNNGNLVIGSDYAPIKELKQGHTMRLWLLRFNGRNKLEMAEKIPLKVDNIDQYLLSQDQKHLLMITNYGNTFEYVNLDTKKRTTIFSSEIGKPGFRYRYGSATKDGKFYVGGYFYDNKRVAGYNYIVEVDPSKKGLKAFTKIKDITWPFLHMKAEDRSPSSFISNGGDGLYLEWETPEGSSFNYWVQDKEITHVRDYKAQRGGWGSGDTVCLAVDNHDGSNEVFVYRADLNKTWDLVRSTENTWFYTFVSEDESTILATEIVDPDKALVNIYVGKASNDYKLEQIKPLTNVVMGVIRLSQDGSSLMFINNEEMKIIDF